MQRISGKVAIVTGGTSGIGTDIVKRFISEGARVAFTGRNTERGQRIETELGDAALFLEHDVSKEADWQRVIQKTIEKWGQLDILVNCAGIMVPVDVENTSHELFEQTMMTNAGGPFLGCKYAIAAMKNNSTEGTLVNVGSTTALKTAPWVMAYGASKAAMLSMTKSIALHCAQSAYKIRCNAVLPGIVMTPMVETMLDAAPDREAVMQSLVASHPIGRLIEGNEVANAVLFFASSESSGITGASFAVDGGMTAG